MTIKHRNGTMSKITKGWLVLITPRGGGYETPVGGWQSPFVFSSHQEAEQSLKDFSHDGEGTIARANIRYTLDCGFTQRNAPKPKRIVPPPKLRAPKPKAKPVLKPPRNTSRDRWTEDEDIILLNMTPSQAARILDRSAGAISVRRSALRKMGRPVRNFRNVR